MALRLPRDHVTLDDLMVIRRGLTNDDAERRITFAEWVCLPEDEPGEFVDGRLVEDEVPGAAHEVIVTWVIAVLHRWLDAKGGVVLGSDAKFEVSALRGRKPDACAYLPGSPMPPPWGVIRERPDIMVEVVSPTLRDTHRDRVEKYQEYAAFGVPWYWIIDPQKRTFEVHELGADGCYVLARSATNGRVACTPALEGLTLDLDALWSRVDRLGPASSEDPNGSSTST